MLETIRFINAIVLGYIINICSIFINYSDDNKIGVLLAFISFGAAYLHETGLLDKYKKFPLYLYWLSFIATVFSILIYLYN